MNYNEINNMLGSLFGETKSDFNIKKTENNIKNLENYIRKYQKINNNSQIDEARDQSILSMIGRSLSEIDEIKKENNLNIGSFGKNEDDDEIDISQNLSFLQDKAEEFLRKANANKRNYEDLCLLIPYLSRIITIIIKDICNKDLIRPNELQIQNIYNFDPTIDKKEQEVISDFITKSMKQIDFENMIEKKIEQSLVNGASPTLIISSSQFINITKKLLDTYNDYNTVEHKSIVDLYEGYSPFKKLLSNNSIKYAKKQMRSINPKIANLKHRLNTIDLQESYGENTEDIESILVDIFECKQELHELYRSNVKHDIDMKNFNKDVSLMESFGNMFKSKENKEKYSNAFVDYFNNKFNINSSQFDIFDDSFAKKAKIKKISKEINGEKQKNDEEFEIVIIMELSIDKLLPITIHDSTHYGYFYINQKEYNAHINKKHTITDIFKEISMNLNEDPLHPSKDIMQVDTTAPIINPNTYSNISNSTSNYNDVAMRTFRNQYSNTTDTEKKQLLKDMIYLYLKNNNAKELQLLDDRISIEFFGNILLNEILEGNTNIEFIFIPTSMIVYFDYQLDDEGYPISIFDKVFFNCILYITVMITKHITEIKRAKGIEIHRVEVNKDGDVEGTIRDYNTAMIKQRSVTDSLYSKNITEHISKISVPEQIVTPMVDGKPPVDIEKREVNSSAYGQEHLDHIFKTICAGMNFPDNLFENINENEFAKNLTQKHELYLNTISNLQKKYAVDINKLLKIYFTHLKNMGKTPKSFDIEKISFKFNPHSAVLVQKLNEAYRRVSETIDNYTNIAIPNLSSSEMVIDELKRQLRIKIIEDYSAIDISHILRYIESFTIKDVIHMMENAQLPDREGLDKLFKDKNLDEKINMIDLAKLNAFYNGFSSKNVSFHEELGRNVDKKEDDTGGDNNYGGY